MDLFEFGYRYHRGLTEYTPFYVDEYGNPNGSDQRNAVGRNQEHQPGTKFCMDIRLKIVATREDL